jgi:hypothetical protein
MSLWCGNSGALRGCGKLGYCIRRLEVLVCSDAYAAERPLSFS